MNDSRRSAVMLSVIACFVSASALAADGNLSGYARVADGDTIETHSAFDLKAFMLPKLTRCVLTLRASLGLAELRLAIPFVAHCRAYRLVHRACKIAMGKSWQHLQLTERILMPPW
jgi:hypothetical protein